MDRPRQEELRRTHEGARGLLQHRGGRSRQVHQRQADPRREHRRQRRHQHRLPCPAERDEEDSPRRDRRLHPRAALLPLVGPRLGLQHAPRIRGVSHHRRHPLAQQGPRQRRPAPHRRLVRRLQYQERRQTLPGKEEARAYLVRGF